MQKSFKSFVLFACLAGSSAANAAGTIVVGGDITGTFNLAPVEYGGLADNRTFFGRVGGGAGKVAINTNTFNSFASDNVVRFYQQGGAQVASLASFSAQSLDGVGLLALVMPNQAFSSSEVAAIGGFVKGGGRLLLLGEASEASVYFPVVGLPDGTRTNAILNGLLGGIGAGIRLDNNTIFGDANQRTTDIRVNPLTAGITSFGYAYVSSVSGGQALFGAPRNLTDGPGPNLAFFATESLGAAVPEPANWALMIGGFGLIGAAMRRRVTVRVSFSLNA